MVECWGVFAAGCHWLPLVAAAALLPSDIYIGTDASSGGQAAFAPQAILEGVGAESVAVAQNASACSAACRSLSSCAWFNLCEEKGGCAAGGLELGQGQCQLLASNCTLIPPVAARDVAADVTAGFPLRYPALSLPGFITHEAQGLQGGDLSCAGSAVEGQCAFASALTAAAICQWLTDCRSVMVYQNGTDGCSAAKLAVLKSSIPSPSNSFVAPTVYVMEWQPQASMDAAYLLVGEAEVLLPSQAELEASAATSSDGAPSNTAWLGCILAQKTLMAGAVTQVLSGVESAEACCRACRERYAQNTTSGGCNVWNFCRQPEGCSYQDYQDEVVLQQGHCELRFQYLVLPTFGWPPAVITKAAEGFTAGAPIAVLGPEVPDYTRHFATGLFGQQGFDCDGSLNAELQECTLRMPLNGLADYCTGDPACAAFVYKPAGLFLSGGGVAYFRHQNGANISWAIHTPSSVLYTRDSSGGSGSSSSGGAGTAGEDSSGSQLPAGAIAGIAAGAAVAALAAALTVWAVVRRQRRNRACATAAAGESAGQTTPGSKPGDGTQQAHRSQDGGGPAEYGGSGPAVQLPPPPPQAAPASMRQGALIALPKPTDADSLQLQPGAPVRPRPALLAAVRTDGDGARLPVAISPFAEGTYSIPTPPTGSARPSFDSCPADTALGVQSSSDATGSSSRNAGASSGTDGQSSAGAPAALAEQHQQLRRQQRGTQSVVLPELMQRRAGEEAAAGGSNTAGSGSAGTGGSGQRRIGLPGDSNSSSSNSGGSSAPTQLVSLALPASLHSWVIPRSSIQYITRANGTLSELGRGASGCVYRAVWNGEVVAAKEFDIGQSQETQEAFVTEAVHMQQLRHQNVVNFYGVSLDGGKGLLLMELCEGRDLTSVLRLTTGDSKERVFGWNRRGRRVALEVAKALNYLHSKGVVHMDIKSSNVLLSSGGTAKLADVGLARLLTRTYLSLVPLVGTFAWVAPEVLLGGQNCSSAVDIYSFGVLLYEIITGERPVRGCLRLPRVPEECPQEASDLMVQCLKQDSNERPTAQQLLHQLMRLQKLPGGGSIAVGSSEDSSDAPKSGDKSGGTTDKSGDAQAVEARHEVQPL